MYFTNDPKLCRLNNAAVYSLSRSASGTGNIERSHRMKRVIYIYIYTHAFFLIIKKEGKQRRAYAYKTVIRSMNDAIINKILSDILFRNNRIIY